MKKTEAFFIIHESNQRHPSQLNDSVFIDCDSLTKKVGRKRELLEDFSGFEPYLPKTRKAVTPSAFIQIPILKYQSLGERTGLMRILGDNSVRDILRRFFGKKRRT
jgi:hypothetical protein